MLILIVIYSNLALNYPIATYLGFFILILILKPISISEEFFSQLPSSSVRLLQTVFNMYFQHGDISKVKFLFEKIKRDVINYASLMKLYNDQSQPEKTLKLFQRMKNEKIERDSVVFVLVINACVDIRFSSLSRSIVKQIPQYLLDDHWLQRSLIYMWVQWRKPQRVFSRIAQPSNVAFSAMSSISIVNAYDWNRRGKEAIELLSQVSMKTINDQIHVCVLNACSHLGLIKESEEIFYGIPYDKRTEKIYAAMVSMRTTILSSVWNKKDAMLAQRIFDRIPLVLSDQNICHQLDQLKSELIQHDYQVDESWVSRSLADGETNEYVRWEHSEELTIAFRLIQKPKPSFIEIVKNLCICQDCHEAIKLITKIH
ncbi:unnamed protein product [Adineta ricciae]|uniref:DYW domain-containing protein n=1 Tax=Adineta ricciae TaxID=249248 RepID=A0A815SRK5_ADIRI|nr:unnamed protein product [Adineta ricciae]